MKALLFIAAQRQYNLSLAEFRPILLSISIFALCGKIRG
jgi:hypothetical protein